MPRRLRCILFDMDGVLVDVSGSYRRAVVETATLFIGRPIDAEVVQQYKNRGGFNDDWRLTYAIVQDSGVDVPFDAIVEEFQLRYRGGNWDGFIVDEPPLISTETLERIGREERLLGLVTGRPEAEASWTLDRFSWRRFFPLRITSDQQQGKGKPDPFPLQLALQVLASRGTPVSPGETAYVGDTVDDMDSARAAGLWAIGFVPPYLDPEAHAAVLIERGAHAVVVDELALANVIDTFFDRVALDPDANDAEVS